MGVSPKSDTYNKAGIGVPLLNGPTEFGKTFPECSLFTTASKRECEENDLLFCVRGSTTGKMNWADRSYSLGRGVCAIRGRTVSITKYIRFVIEDKLKELLNFATGGTFPNLSKEVIENFEIDLKPNTDKIASILSTYDDLIENNLRRIKLLRSGTNDL